MRFSPNGDWCVELLCIAAWPLHHALAGVVERLDQERDQGEQGIIQRLLFMSCYRMMSDIVGLSVCGMATGRTNRGNERMLS